MNFNWLKNFESKMVSRYSERFQKFGFDPRTLGWDNHSNQNKRFLTAIQSAEVNGKSILDVGCGFSDFYSFLNEYYGKNSAFRYAGIDINSDLINECKNRFPDVSYEVRNILVDPYQENSWDVVTMFGLLNYKIPDYDNLAYAKNFITNAFNVAKDCLIVDMLSSIKNVNYPSENFVNYHEPAVMLDFALSLTPYVKVVHSGDPIPQKEFTLILGKHSF